MKNFLNKEGVKTTEHITYTKICLKSKKNSQKSFIFKVN